MMKGMMNVNALSFSGKYSHYQSGNYSRIHYSYSLLSYTTHIQSSRILLVLIFTTLVLGLIICLQHTKITNDIFLNRNRMEATRSNPTFLFRRKH